MTNSIVQKVNKWEKYTLGFSHWVGQDSKIVAYENKTWDEGQRLLSEHSMKYGMHSLNYNKTYDKDGKSGQIVLYL